MRTLVCASYYVQVASYFDPDFWTAYDDANTKCSALGTDAHPTQLDWSTFNCSYTNVSV
jgi:hypothetical protein